MSIVHLVDALRARERSQLSVAPVSRSVVEAVLEVARDESIPLTLGVDRRFLPSTAPRDQAGPDFSMDALRAWVTERDDEGLVLLGRDLAGPGANSQAETSRLTEAENRARVADDLIADAENGASILHLDASQMGEGSVSLELEIDRQTDVVTRVATAARDAGRSIAFTLGAHQRHPEDDALDGFRTWLERSLTSLDDAGLPQPLFVVAKIGTALRGLANAGSLARTQASVDRVSPRDEAIAEVAAQCESNGVFLRVLDGDHLPISALRALHPLGIDSLGIGPALAAQEMRIMAKLAEAIGYRSLKDELLQLSLDAREWTRLLPENLPASDYERALVGGLYVFGASGFQSIKARLEARCGAAGVLLDEILQDAHQRELRRYLRELGAVQVRQGVVDHEVLPC
ncbi:MAG: hypothetical protein KDB53_21330 [Planctomycetes bacterium]|nr:hypothetical protein [Planctomycetota bacterium]